MHCLPVQLDPVADEDEEGEETKKKRTMERPERGKRGGAKGTFPRDKIRFPLSAPFRDTGLGASRGTV